MASQLVAKSEAANSWGGRAIWIVQDLLADYIGTHTALPLDDLRSPDWTPGEVNMVVSDLSGPVALYSGPIRAAGGDRKCWFELLGAPHVPTLESMTRKLDEIPPVATFRVPRSPVRRRGLRSAGFLGRSVSRFAFVGARMLVFRVRNRPQPPNGSRGAEVRRADPGAAVHSAWKRA